jgi:hypothetical protein
MDARSQRGLLLPMRCRGSEVAGSPFRAASKSVFQIQPVPRTERWYDPILIHARYYHPRHRRRSDGVGRLPAHAHRLALPCYDALILAAGRGSARTSPRGPQNANAGMPVRPHTCYGSYSLYRRDAAAFFPFRPVRILPSGADETTKSRPIRP